MSLVRFVNRLANLFRRNAVDREIEQELHAHIELRIEDNIANGMSPEQARRNALLRFGNPVVTRERTTESDIALYLESLWADTHYALRQLARSPGFAITALLTLALGIGANLAVFQLLNGVMFAKLPVPHPEQLQVVHGVKTPFDHAWYFSFPAFERLRKASSETTPVAAHSWIGEGVLQQTDGSHTNSTRVDYQMISDNFFSVLELTPALGRFFQPGDDDRQQAEWPVILRYSFFEQQFGADPSIIGKRAVVNGAPVVIIGVTPKGFAGVLQWKAPDLWLPLAAQSSHRFGVAFDSLGPGFGLHLERPWIPQANIFWLIPIVRIAPSQHASASALLTAAITPDLNMMADATKDAHEKQTIRAARIDFFSAANGEGSLYMRYATPLILMMAMSGVILLIGSLNLANLQMARLTQREREFNIRIALGAIRMRVLRQVAIESSILTALGGALALITGRTSSELLLQWASGRGRAFPIDLSINPQGYLVAAALLSLTLIGFGVLPAWLITRKGFSSVDHSRVAVQTGQSKAARRASNSLLASQVCLSLLLLSSATVFAETLRNIAHIDTGMDRSHIVSIHLDMRSTGFAEQQRDLPGLYRLILDRLKALPMVSDAAVSMCDIPQCGWNTAMHVSGHPEYPESRLHGEENHVGSGYFRTLGISLLAGRDFNQHDTEQTQKVAILNRTFARQLFGDQNPIGHWIGYNAPPHDHDFLIVGVVADARINGPRQPIPAVAYLSLDQDPVTIGTIEVRSRGSEKSLNATVREALHNAAPSLPITEIVPLDLELEDDLGTELLVARLTTVFGALALALAALGFYGLVSFRVARRTREIGLRMALGATRANVQSLFLRSTLFVLLAGAIPGIVLSSLIHSVIQKLMYRPDSPAILNSWTTLWALTFAILLLTGVGILASLHPARKAASTEPVEALRAE
jgi:predicted permease